MRVLLVEDHPDVATSTKLLLELLGHEVKHAATGAEAIEIAEVFEPQMMLVDIGLPDMDGFIVAKTLRADPKFEKTIMVALTGFDCEAKAKQFGFDYYCKKPMDVEHIDRFMPASGAL